MMAAFESNTGQAQPNTGVNTEAPEIEGWKRGQGKTTSSVTQGGKDTLEFEGARDADAKAGEIPLIEETKDKTAEGMARNLCDRIGEWNWQRAGIWAGRSEDSANINIDKANTAKNIFSK